MSRRERVDVIVKYIDVHNCRFREVFVQNAFMTQLFNVK